MKFPLQVITTVIVGLLLLPFVATAQAQNEATPQLPKVIRKSGGVLQQSAVKRVEPVYPPMAKTAKVSGPVVVELTVDEEGNVIAAKAVSGHPLLKDAAVEAAKGWKFNPTTLSGHPVKVIGNITFNFNLGSADAAKGIPALQEAVRQHPDSATAHYDLGLAYYHTERYTEAESEFREAIKINPNSAEAHAKLGLAVGLLQRYQESANEFEAAIRLSPDDAEVVVGLGLAYAALYRYEDAIKAFKKGIELAPTVAETYTYLGMTYSVMGRKADAIEAYKQGLIKWPDNPHAHFRLGLVYAQTGDKQAAMDEYATLKKLDAELAERLLKEINQ